MLFRSVSQSRYPRTVRANLYKVGGRGSNLFVLAYNKDWTLIDWARIAVILNPQRASLIKHLPNSEIRAMAPTNLNLSGRFVYEKEGRLRSTNVDLCNSHCPFTKQLYEDNIGGHGGW